MSEPEKVVIDDLIVLGNACPDEISDSRKTVCTAGFSPKHGLIRVYPVPPGSAMYRWNIVKIPLERNTQDNRPESWKVQGSKREWANVSKRIEKVGALRQKHKQQELLEMLYSRYGAGCVEEFNRKRLSLGFVKPTISGYSLIKRQDYDPTVQVRFGEKVVRFLTIKNYPLKPILSYRCSDCETKRQHHQQILEWGVYEWMRLHPDKPEQMWENLRLDKEGYECFLLVGNNNRYRSSFMVISILPIGTKTEMRGKALPASQSTLLQYGDGMGLRFSRNITV